MIKKSLIKLRRQPKHIRNHVAMGVAGVFTFVVFGIWAFNLPSALESRNGGNTATIFSSVVDDVKDGASSISNASENNPFQDLFPEEELEPETSLDTIMSIVNSSTTDFAIEENTEEARVVRIATTTSSSSLSAE